MSSHRPSAQGNGRRRVVPLVWLGSAAAVLLLALGINGSVAAWTASITNSANTAGTGTLMMEETGPDGAQGTAVCTSNTATAACSTINKYGGNEAMSPGQTVTTVVTISNTGTVPATTFTLQAGACTQTPAAAPSATPVVGDLCSLLAIAVTGSTDPTSVFSGTPTEFAAAGPITLTAPLEPGDSEDFTFGVTIPAGADNTHQGIAVSQPLTWTFGA